MKKYILQLAAALLATMALSSCLGNLDTQPLDDNDLVGTQVYSTADGYMGVLAKCYGSLILTGQQGGDGGNGDLEGANEGYSGYVRLMFYLQELNTDEFLMPSSSNGLRKMLNLQWDASNAGVLTWTYQRLYMCIAYCDEFLRECTPDKIQSRGLQSELGGKCHELRAEARFLRAYCYATLCDLFGNVPYVDENTAVTDLPVQMTRQETFAYAESELKAVLGENASEDILGDAGATEYGHVNKAAAWFQLARLYLNAHTWIGTDRYNDCLTYCKKVIDCGKFPLAADYRQIFLADNNTCSEIIWPLVQDGLRAQSSAGTNFYVKAFVNGAMDSYYQTGVETRGWGNVRAKMTLVDMFDAADVPFDTNDTWGNNKNDKRAQFMTALPGQRKETYDDNGAMTSTFTCGYGYIKWRNVTKDDKVCASGTQYTSIDFPMFRSADAYLMAAEAIMRGASGTKADAVKYVNEVRERAYMTGKYAKAGVKEGVGATITESQLTFDFLLAERSREMASEICRRTDLIRFGKFTKGYNWDWKDAVRDGKDVEDYLQLFPIPEAELTNNSLLKQNPGYPTK
ncbi:MAG: RagB/SusD family nutrient uptake outer membrane protein [Muribaculaceae bacterium]|nr:RagB/SusD family nutrient uptake outer membrane protein [Muribaculaceae bacterium]